jgi:hypothetical protein
MPGKSAITISVILILSLITPALSHSQESKELLVTYARGRIYSVDFAYSRITIQWLYTTDKISQDKITFFVPGNASISTEKSRIFKGTRRAGIADLVIGDHVVIKYYVDKNKKYQELISMRILEYDAPV